MRRVTLPELLERATAYEGWSAPLSPALRYAAWLSGGALSWAALVAHVLGQPWRPLLLGPLGAALLLLMIGGIRSGGFRRAPIRWHLALLAPVALGACVGLLISLALAVPRLIARLAPRWGDARWRSLG